MAQKSYQKVIKLVFPAIFWIAVWWAVSAWVGQELLVPSPVSVLNRFWELARTLSFWRTAGTSLLRIFCGTTAGILLGTFCAIITCRFSIANALLSPAIKIIRATPVASFIILILLWVKTNQVPGVISALMVLPVLWESVSIGIRTVDPQLLEFSSAYQLGTGKTLRYIYFPSVRPHFIAGVNNAIGLAWKSGVAAEVLCVPKSAIGTQVYYSKIYLETPSLFSWTAVVILLSMALEKIVHKLLDATEG